MLTLITGVPGSGKSLFAVRELLKVIEENKRIAKIPEAERAEGQIVRSIFVDIDGWDHERFGTQVAPPDWRETPDGSLVVYDECQQKFGPDGGGRSKNPVIQAFEVHRHTGHDIWLITQRERLLHPHIRDLVGRHYHIKRMYGSKVVKVFRRDETIKTDSISQLNQCDCEVWRYDKKLFNCYKSATVHTHKFKIPRKLLIAIICLVTFFSIALVLGLNSKLFALPFADKNTVQQDYLGVDAGTDQAPVTPSSASNHSTATSTRPRPAVSDAPATRYMGCVVWGDDTQCECFDQKGYPDSDLSFSKCIDLAEGSTLAFVSEVRNDKRGHGAKHSKDDKDEDSKALSLEGAVSKNGKQQHEKYWRD